MLSIRGKSEKSGSHLSLYSEEEVKINDGNRKKKSSGVKSSRAWV